MENRRIFSYICFIVGVVAFLLFGLLSGQWVTGLVVGLACVLFGIFWYRRGM